MHTIEKKEMIPVIHIIITSFLWAFFNALKDVPGYPIPVQGMQEIAFLRVQFYKFPGEGACPQTPLGVHASGTQRSHQQRKWCMSASWNTASGTSKCYRKPCATNRNTTLSAAIYDVHYISILFANDLSCSWCISQLAYEYIEYIQSHT